MLDVYARALAGSQDRRAVRDIPQQVTALLDNTAGPAGEADEELAELLLRLRFIALYHLLELGDSTPQAIAVGEPLTADLERLLGPDHPDTLNSRNSLAAAYLAAGRVAEAIPLFEQTLAVRQRLLGPDHPETLTSQNNLASAYQDAGRIAEAIRLYELTLAIRERLLGADHPSTLNSRGNLAAAYLAAGRIAEAIPLLEQTLAGRERVLGPDHPDTRTSRKNLAKPTGTRAGSRRRSRCSSRPRPAGTSTGSRSPRMRGPQGKPRQRLPEWSWSAEPIPPVGRTSAARESQPPAGAAAHAVLPVSADLPPTRPGGCFRRISPASRRSGQAAAS